MHNDIFEKTKLDFPALVKTINGKRLVYLDNAATTLTPQKVIDAIVDFNARYKSNVHRSVHSMGVEATEKFESARGSVARFIGAEAEEIIFTSGTTSGLNMLATMLTKNLKPEDEVVLTEMEHHSNIVPWQQAAKTRGFKIKYIKVNAAQGILDLQSVKEIISPKTKIVSVTHVSNVLGTVNDLNKISELAKQQGALFVVDGAQGAPHTKINVKDVGCDFYVFSGHKMLAPTGVGVVYGKKEILETLEPVIFGGGMISCVDLEKAEWAESPYKFEPGTPNIEGVIGLGAAIEYLENIGIENIEAHENNLAEYAINELAKINGVEIYGSKVGVSRCAVVSFNVAGVHPHDLAEILNRDNIAIRVGHHCAMPLMNILGVGASARASFYFYNTKEDADALCKGIINAKKIFNA